MDRSDSRLALAQAAIDKAQKIDSKSGQTHLALADHLYCVYFDFYGAQRELELARRTLPNEPHLFELAGYIDRRQGRWNECVKNLRKALELDPRNFAILQNLALTFDYMRLFSEEVAVQDKALQLLPKDVGARVQRAAIELKWHGNTKPLHSQIQDILSEGPSAAAEVADSWVFLALSEHDYRMAELALAALPPDGHSQFGIFFSSRVVGGMRRSRIRRSPTCTVGFRERTRGSRERGARTAQLW